MLVDLRILKDNPFRDFKIDPIDQKVVDQLAESIEEDGFWSGVVCRQVDANIEIAAGHHRRLAALKAGLTAADVYVGEFDDHAMIRVYARENATQRGNTGTAMAGSVASAIHFLAKAILTDHVWIQTWVAEQGIDLEAARVHLTSNQGLGWEIVLAFLRQIPGISRNSINQQLANLKTSGDYARIIEEIQTDIEREEREAAAALERAEAERKEAEEAERAAEAERKAAAERAKRAREEAAKKRAEFERQQAEVKAQLQEKRRKEAEKEAERIRAQATAAASAGASARKATTTAKKQGIIFDFEGVSRHLKNALQVSAFRDAVTQPSVAKILMVKKQAELAALLVQLARSRKTDITANFIRDNIMVQAQQMMGMLRKESAEERRRREEHNAQLQMESHQGNFARHLRGLNVVGQQIVDLIKRHPNVDFQVTVEFRKAVSDAEAIINQLNGRFGYGEAYPKDRPYRRPTLGQSPSSSRSRLPR